MVPKKEEYESKEKDKQKLIELGKRSPPLACLLVASSAPVWGVSRGRA